MMVRSEMIPGYDLNHFSSYSVEYFLKTDILFRFRLGIFFSQWGENNPIG